MTVVAFDIDGTLTEDIVFETYNELSQRYDTTIGIVTRRPPNLSTQFVEDNQVQPAFVKNRVIKTIAFNNIEDSIDGDTYIYVGNRISDYTYAKLAGWQFVLAQNVESTKDIVDG